MCKDEAPHMHPHRHNTTIIQIIVSRHPATQPSPFPLPLKPCTCMLQQSTGQLQPPFPTPSAHTCCLRRLRRLRCPRCSCLLLLLLAFVEQVLHAPRTVAVLGWLQD